jgi:hypothetical protein
MSNISVAFAVLAALFWIYVIAALSRSRGADPESGRNRHPWQLLIARIRRAVQCANGRK